MNARSLFLCGAVAAALAAPAAPAAGADCPLASPGAAAEHAIRGTGLVARDPYGGTLPRNRLFFDFSVRGDGADLAQVAKVEWAMDGAIVRADPTVPFEWKGLSGSSKRMPAGDHTIVVTVTGKDGARHSATFALTATDCQPISFWAFPPSRKGQAGQFTMSSAFEAEGPPLDAVVFSAVSNIGATLPAAVRGAEVGTLEVVKIAGGRPRGTKHALRAPRTGATLLREGDLRVVLHPGAKRMLEVSGLPPGTQAINLTVGKRLFRLKDPCKPFRVRGTARSGKQTASATNGGRVAC